MKVKYEFAIRQIAGEYVLVPLGRAALQFSGMLTTSEVGAFIFRTLAQETSLEELKAKLMEEYEVDEQTAAADLEEFLAQLRKLKLLEE